MLIVFTVIVLLFVLLNPSMNQFKEFLGKEKISSDCRRVNNFLVYSIYENENTDQYVGILSNFIQLRQKIVNLDVRSTIDSTKVADSIKAESTGIDSVPSHKR